MKRLTISFDQPQIEINGLVFDLKKSDADIFRDAMDILEQYRDLPQDPEAIREAVQTLCGYVDTILGEGAMRKISGGRPVGVNKAQECMILIARAAAESYDQAILDEYGE